MNRTPTNLPGDGEVFTARRWRPPLTDEAPPFAQSIITEPANPSAPIISAKPFVWRDPSTIPCRRWLYGKHLIRKFLSTTVSPGAVGKSSLVMVELVAMATGRPLLGINPSEGKMKVWYWNGEDPYEELERRIAAICLFYGIDPKELDGQLFMNSGRDTEIIVATSTKAGTTIAVPTVDAMTATIRDNQIDAMVLDPFIAAHSVSENDNAAIGAVATAIARIADATNSACDLVHHVRKAAHGQEITVEDGRGAVALLAASRSSRVLNQMSKEEAVRAGVDNPRSYFRVDNGKSNLAPAPDKSEWFALKSQSLGNGIHGDFATSDHVAVVTPWTWPDCMDDVTVADLRKVQVVVAAGRFRENHQAKNWVGKAVAQVIGLDVDDKGQKDKILALLKRWLGTGMFVVVEGEDEKRMKRSFIEVGQWATD